MVLQIRIASCLLLILLVVVPLAAAQPAKDLGAEKGAAAKGDRALLYGKWEITAVQENGKNIPLEKDVKRFLIFFDSRIKIMVGDRVINDTYFSVDETKTPKAIDLIDKWDREKPDLNMLGIYELTIDKDKSDSLKLCLARQSSYKKEQVKFKKNDREKERPTEFVSKKDIGLIVLKRVRLDRGDLFGNRLLDPEQEYLTLKQIAQGMQLFEKDKKTFPAAAICTAAGKPLLSWRVAILPYIDQTKLYRLFKLNEPWDSPNNAKLIPYMPDVYYIAAAKAKRGHTHFRVFVGPGAGFEMNKGMKPSDIKDGLATTFMVVQAADAVEWTKPEELVYSPKDPLPEFADFTGEGRFFASFYDGRVRELNAKLIPEKTFRALITRAGGEIGPFDLGPKDKEKDDKKDDKEDKKPTSFVPRESGRPQLGELCGQWSAKTRSIQVTVSHHTPRTTDY
jgi:uncharacterized protein (TIGR03067 family)